MPEPESKAIEPPAPDRSGNRYGSVADGLILLLLLCLANTSIARDDPGFLALNPTPWILVPFVLGARHGLLAGLAGSLVTTLVVFIGFKYFKGASDFAAMITGNAYYFVSLLAAAAIGGLVHRLLAGPAESAQDSVQLIADSHQRLLHELSLAQTSTHELAQRLLLHDADIITLQDRVQQLFALGSDDSEKTIERRLLELFRDLFAVNAAAIYQRAPNASATGGWQCLASIGAVSGGGTSTSFDASEHPVVAAAIENRDISTCASLWKDVSPQAPASPPSATLAAIPWSRAASKEASRVLVIDRMPFAQANWENLARIQALFDWVTTVSTTDADPTLSMAAATGQSIIAPEAFSQQIDLALDFAARLHLSFRLVLFEPTPDADLARQQAFVQSVQIHRRPGDTIGGVVLISDSAEAFAIGLLIPVSTDSAAELRVKEMLKHVPGGSSTVHHHILTIDSDTDRFNHQWNALIQPAVVAK